MAKEKAAIENGVEITEDHIRLCRVYAGRLSRQYRVPLDDAICSAYGALVDAKRLFDPTKGVAFETYLISKIKWESYRDWRRANTTRTSREKIPISFVELQPSHIVFDSATEKLIDAKRALEQFLKEKPHAQSYQRSTRAQYKKIYRAHLNGEGPASIARRLKFSRCHVIRILKEVRKLKRQLVEDLDL